MKKNILVPLLFFVHSVFSQSHLLADTIMLKALAPEGYYETNRLFENFMAISTEGKYYNNDSFKGKVTFVNFWYEGCQPCIAETRPLNGLYGKFKNNKAFQFFSFTFEDTLTIKKFKTKHNIEYPIMNVDQTEIYRLLFHLGFPTSMIIDGTGKIRYVKCGGSSEFSKAESTIDSIYVPYIQKLLMDE